jgi:hypothetical protein
MVLLVVAEGSCRCLVDSTAEAADLAAAQMRQPRGAIPAASVVVLVEHVGVNHSGRPTPDNLFRAGREQPPKWMSVLTSVFMSLLASVVARRLRRRSPKKAVSA